MFFSRLRAMFHFHLGHMKHKRPRETAPRACEPCLCTIANPGPSLVSVTSALPAACEGLQDRSAFACSENKRAPTPALLSTDSTNGIGTALTSEPSNRTLAAEPRNIPARNWRPRRQPVRRRRSRPASRRTRRSEQSGRRPGEPRAAQRRPPPAASTCSRVAIAPTGTPPAEITGTKKASKHPAASSKGSPPACARIVGVGVGVGVAASVITVGRPRRHDGGGGGARPHSEVTAGVGTTIQLR